MIRKAELNDLAAIAELEKKYIEVAWTLDQLTESFESGLYDFFVVDEGEVAAYGFIQWSGDEGNICNIATSENFRHRGFALGILDIVTAEAKKKGVTKLFLEVSEDNIPARSLYKKAGFAEIAVRKGYYGENAAVVMQKTI